MLSGFIVAYGHCTSRTGDGGEGSVQMVFSIWD